MEGQKLRIAEGAKQLFQTGFVSNSFLAVTKHSHKEKIVISNAPSFSCRV